MHVSPVTTSADRKAFINLPYQLYRDDPVWVPPLKSELNAQFDPARNPFLDHCEHTLFLLMDNDGRPIGRIAAFIDHLALEHWKEQIGLFGYFECAAGQEGADMLLGAARDWLRQHGMAAMRGPWTFVSQEWGLVIEGFTPSPCIMAPYNPPRYNDLVTGFGLKKAKDLVAYEIDVAKGYRIPRRIIELTRDVASRYGITTRQVNMKDFDNEVNRIVDLSNASIGDNWSFVPVTNDEIHAMAKDLKPVIHPRGVIFAEDRDGNTIGFGLAIPDVNVILKNMNGSLLPLGWARLLWQLPRLRKYRMFALGVMPQYQGKAVDSLIYKALYDALHAPGASMEINYVLEDNAPMNNAILKLGATPMRRYRVYEMDI